MYSRSLENKLAKLCQHKHTKIPTINKRFVALFRCRNVKCPLATNSLSGQKYTVENSLTASTKCPYVVKNKLRLPGM